MTRSRHRFVRWVFKALSSTDGHPPIYSAQCTTCYVEPSEAFDDPSGAERWSMRHAAQLDAEGKHHTVFRMIVTSFAVVRPHPAETRIEVPWLDVAGR
ncbi:hypothetical protein AS594_06985 [Streptomyces agglomeratus]|uniref:DUF7848 domain-containing protein n=1 Tax=Streptomyces agglomeratus TaxID=285458 RepID=A0A1E5P3Z5_9ACTN|nr:hypothetical protein [Streptomyces agglomeratus]OEJ24266.1 hypothetical protein AS594_06985 [Streptomyces agglomeratus]